jgi:hypothetical protein
MFLFRLIYDLLHNFQLAYREGLWDATVAGSAHKAWSLEGNSYFILTLLLDIIILLRNYNSASLASIDCYLFTNLLIQASLPLWFR